MAHRYNLDNRDHGKAQRMPLLNGKTVFGAVISLSYCSEVCPKHVDPASAINQGKVESAKDYVISMLKPKAKGKNMSVTGKRKKYVRPMTATWWQNWISTKRIWYVKQLLSLLYGSVSYCFTVYFALQAILYQA